MDPSELDIQKFKLGNMVDHPSIVMIAKRGQGKSYVTRDILHYYRKKPCGAIISPTEKFSPFYKYFFADLYIHHDIDIVLLEKILRRQIKMKRKEKIKERQGKKIDSSAIIVMDDCLAQASLWKKDKTVKEILMNGRHYNLTYILTMQTPLGIGPDLRLNFDYIFLLRDDSSINRKKLYENYASMFSSRDIFEQAFTECTQDFKCMVIDNRCSSSELSDKIFWYKAESKLTFSFGSKGFRKMHEKYYNPKYLDNEAENLFGNNKTKGGIKIKIKDQ
jgi:hypothetical protein